MNSLQSCTRHCADCTPASHLVMGHTSTNFSAFVVSKAQNSGKVAQDNTKHSSITPGNGAHVNPLRCIHTTQCVVQTAKFLVQSLRSCTRHCADCTPASHMVMGHTSNIFSAFILNECCTLQSLHKVAQDTVQTAHQHHTW